MSPTGAGDEEHLSKTEESEVISDVDHNDELDSDIKLELCNSISVNSASPTLSVHEWTRFDQQRNDQFQF